MCATVILIECKLKGCCHGPPPVQSLRGKVVLITGASTGIGRAAADRVAATGATVIGTSRWPWRYPAPPNWELFQMDQTSDDSVKQLISRLAGQALPLPGSDYRTALLSEVSVRISQCMSSMFPCALCCRERLSWRYGLQESGMF